MVTVIVDGRSLETEEGRTLLEAARAAGIKIPALCWHPALKPVGACKVCAVEVAGREGPTIRLACLQRVREGLSVRTDSHLAVEARTKALADLWRLAPQAQCLLDLAREHGLELPPAPDNCLRCRLCLRVCHDVVGAGALKMEKRRDQSYITAREGRCLGCGTCANICPTGAIRCVDREGFRTIIIRDEVIGRNPLEKCEVCGRLFATEKFLDRVEARAARDHPEVKEHHRRCPTCAKLFSPRIKSSERLKMR
ncbi:MAG: 2Fe-2S iron-sulfur cluster-binding protein [Thermodesulfobacteriota bacterium]